MSPARWFSLIGMALLASCSDDPPPKDDFSLYACKEPSTNKPNGNHNAGLDCNGACHNHGFTIAGTVFVDEGGTMPAVGAHVLVRDADLKIIDMITADNGNFYTKESFKLPFRTWVTSCPDVELMPDYVDTNFGPTPDGKAVGCNQAICHQNAGGTGVITLRQ